MKKNSIVAGFIAGVVVSLIVCSIFTLVYFKPFSCGNKAGRVADRKSVV